MHRLILVPMILSLTWKSPALAQDTVAVRPEFPPTQYTPLPPHFQPRRVTAPVGDKVTAAPPPLPIYEQPPIPAEGYIWVPGFWARRKSVPDYFWVPGTWVQPPRLGLLWTPPYWSKVDGIYAFRAGYWATEVGFYGGINYGYGYGGNGYQGGRWEKGTFSYNRAVNNLGSLTLPKVFDEKANSSDNATRVSFNGGRNGVAAQPTKHQSALPGNEHIGPTDEQHKHLELAAMDRSLYSKLNNGEPGVAATSYAGEFESNGVTHSRGDVRQ